MPLRSRRRRTRRRNARRSRRGRRGRRGRAGYPTHIARPIISGNQTGDSVMVSMKLGTISTVSPGAPSTRVAMFGNDVFAPDPAFGSVRQPIGFDQWSTQFERFEVLGSSVSTRLVNLSSTGVINWVVYPAYNIGINLTYGDAVGQRYAKTAFCESLGSGNATSRVFHSMGTYKLLGRHTASINFTGSDDSSPTKRWEWVYEFTNPEGSNLSFSFQTNVTYHTRFYERKPFVDA